MHDLYVSYIVAQQVSCVDRSDGAERRQARRFGLLDASASIAISRQGKAESMGATLKDKMARLTPERRARIEAEADRLHAEYQTLKDLRKARDLTQAKLAETLGIRQATIAQLE
jgi:DNA-binding XRE family transcriptional regulator